MDKPQVARDTPVHIVHSEDDKPVTYEDHLTMVVRYFEEAEDTCREARKLSERDIDYVHNDQWTEEELAILRKRKQPALTINQIKRKVETMRGMERRMRSDPKAFPRTPQEEQGAEAATDALRFVADQNSFDEVRSQVYEDMIIPGYGGAEVTVTEAKGGYDIKVTRVPWDRLFYDPHSTLADFSDAKYKGIVIWMDRQEAIDAYPDAEDAIQDTLGYRGVDTYEDKPREGMWCDSKRTRLRAVQMHYRHDGEWMVGTFTRGGWLTAPMVSPYKDKEGNSCSSLKLRAMYIDRDNNRYGHVRDLISLQDEINKRRSKALHLLSVRQSYGNKKGVPDAQKARQELAKPDGHVELNADAVFGQDFGVLPTGDMAQGQLQLLQEATAEMQATGANAALAGTDPRGQSGRAQQLQQQAGQVTLEPGLDALRHWSRDIYEQIWTCVRQFWTAEKWVRVTDDERNLKWVGLNKKVTLGDKIKTLPPKEQQQVAQELGIQSPFDPKLKQVVDVENDVSGLDVDIVIEEGPDLASLQSEQFETLAGLAKSGIPIPPKAIIQASAIRNKDAILDEMESGKQLPPEVQQKMQELEQQLGEAQKQLADRSAEFQLKDRELQIKEHEASIKGQEAESRMIQAQQPDQVDPGVPAKDLADAELKMAQKGRTDADAEYVRLQSLQLANSLGTEGVATEVDEETGEAKPGALQLLTQMVADMAAGQAQSAQTTHQMMALLAAPKRLVRDEAGTVVGAEPVL